MSARTVKLREVLDVQNGFAFKKEFFSDSEGFPLIRIRDLDKDATVAFYTSDYRDEFLIQPSDYLIGMDGNFRCHKWAGPVALLNQRVCRLHKFTNQVLPEYVFYGIQRALSAIEATTAFVTVKHISAKQILDIELTLPPIHEQHRIVDLLSRADGIVRLRREAQKKAAELIPAIFLEMFGDPRTNPKGWPVHELGALLAAPPTLGTMAKPSTSEADWLDLRVANIQGGQLTLEDRKWLNLPPEQVERFSLKAGDIVLARAIGSLDHLGKAVVVQPTSNWTFDSHLMRIRLDSKRILPDWLVAFLSSAGGRAEFLKHTRHSAVQFNINGKELRRLLVPLPSLGLQQQFYRRSEDIRSITSQQTTATARAQATFNALLASAFVEG